MKEDPHVIWYDDFKEERDIYEKQASFYRINNKVENVNYKQFTAMIAAEERKKKLDKAKSRAKNKAARKARKRN